MLVNLMNNCSLKTHLKVIYFLTADAFIGPYDYEYSNDLLHILDFLGVEFRLLLPEI